MQIQMREGVELRGGAGVPANTADGTVRAEIGPAIRVWQRNAVETTASENLFRDESERYGVRQAHRVFRVGFMRHQRSRVENEVGSRRR
jgi:hypothetical protein